MEWTRAYQILYELRLLLILLLTLLPNTANTAAAAVLPCVDLSRTTKITFRSDPSRRQDLRSQTTVTAAKAFPVGFSHVWMQIVVLICRSDGMRVALVGSLGGGILWESRSALRKVQGSNPQLSVPTSYRTVRVTQVAAPHRRHPAPG